MFEFAYPWLLLGLPLPWLVYLLLPPYRQRARALRIPFFAELIAATDLETSINTEIEVMASESDGSVAVPAKILLDTLKDG